MKDFEDYLVDQMEAGQREYRDSLLRRGYRRLSKNQRKTNLRLAIALMTLILAFSVGVVLYQRHDNYESGAPETSSDMPMKLVTKVDIEVPKVDVKVEEPIVEVDEPEEPAPEAIEHEESPVERLVEVGECKITHYCICKKCCGKDPDHPAYGITASGRKAEPYLSVAVDRSIIPLGSEVIIDYGNGNVDSYRADDVGGAIKGNRIDVCVEDHQTGRELGVKFAKVYYVPADS